MKESMRKISPTRYQGIMFDVEAVPGRRASRQVDDPRNWRVAVPGRYPPGARPYIVHDLMLTWYIQRGFCAFSITFY